jgi:hypothetical protein
MRPAGSPMSDRPPGPNQIRAQERHAQKLKDIREQVSDGSLVIRKMTADERKRYPPQEPDARRRRPKRGS